MSNDNQSNVVSFNDHGEYTDFRVLLRDAARLPTATRKGILIWIADDGSIKLDYVANCRDLAFAAVHLAKDATEET